MTPDKNGVTRQSVRGTQVPTRTSGDYSDFFPVQRKTRLPGGYMGKILRVDLGTGKLAGLNITGAAPQPMYLYVGEDKVELRDARRIWGKGARETEEMLRAESGHPDARIGCIGPAGENLVRAAMFVNDYNHTAAHGLGAVMGSKKLKAIVVWGTQRPRVVSKENLIDAG